MSDYGIYKGLREIKIECEFGWIFKVFVSYPKVYEILSIDNGEGCKQVGNVAEP